MKHYPMRTNYRVFVIAVAGLLTFFGIGTGRQIESWSYENLLKEADLVVIARAVSTVPSKDKWEAGIFDRDRFKGLETTFELAIAFKGKSAGTFKVLHFQYKNPSRPLEDGPGLVSFLSEPLSVDVGQSGKTGEEGWRTLQPTKSKSLMPVPEYLLFLKKRADDRFEAVSGQVDPNSSVRTLLLKKESLRSHRRGLQQRPDQ